MAKQAAGAAGQNRNRIRTDATVVLLATIGIAVVGNALLLRVPARVDLTETKAHTLSPESAVAARALEGVSITVYVSKRLPESIPTQGGKTSLKGVDRAFRDKIDEYVAASNGKLRVVYADQDVPNAGTVEEQAEAAKLELFSSTEAQVEGNQLKFARYALGATFHYKSVSEVLPKALEPGFFEFEITKRLLRLRDKHEQSQLMKDVLSDGKRLHEAVKKCADAIREVTKDQAEGQAAGLDLTKLATDQKGLQQKLESGKGKLDGDCAPVNQILADSSKKLEGRSEFVDNLLKSSQQFFSIYNELLRYLRGEGPKEVTTEAALPQLVNMLDQIGREVEQRHQTLVDSPGQRKIGFLCGHMEFCPFAERESLMDPQMAAMIQNNQMMKQIAETAQQISSAIDQTNSRVGDGLFAKQGYAITKVESGKPIPSDIAALVVFGPRSAIPEFDRFQLDQFLLSGRPVAVFAQQWEVAINNMIAPKEIGQDVRLDHTALERTGSDLPATLAPYGIILGNDLVVDPRHSDTVRVMELLNRGGMRFQSERDFAYPLIPVFTDFSRNHALSRSIQSMSIPYTTTVTIKPELKTDSRFEVHELIKSAPEALARDSGLSANPLALQQAVVNQSGTGPHVVAVVARGPFKSAFVGKDPPRRPKPKPRLDQFGPPEKEETEDEYALVKRNFKPDGQGKILVLGSNLGIEGLSRGAVLRDFNATTLSKFSVEALQQYQEWQSRFQNWQIRVTQVSHLLQENLRFLSNVLDWATAHEALADIRSKGDTRRPMTEVKAEDARTLRLAAMVGTPLVLIILGFGRMRFRRRRVELAAAAVRDARS